MTDQPVWLAHTRAALGDGSNVATQCGAPYEPPPFLGGYTVRVCPDCSAPPLPHSQTMLGRLEHVRPAMRQWVRSLTPDERLDLHEAMSGIATASMRDPSTQPPLWTESDLLVMLYVLSCVRAGLADHRQSGQRLTHAEMNKAIDRYEMLFVALVEGLPEARA